MKKDIGAVAWLDFETTDVPRAHDEVIDFRNLHILEVGLIITDLDLKPLVGYDEVVKLTPEAATALKGNEITRKMHTENGLIKASAASSKTMAEIERELIDAVKGSIAFQPGEFAIAGSGTERFDLPLIQAKMPELAKWFAYFTYDFGIMRRVTTMANRGNFVVNPVNESFMDGVKRHRAYADVEAHLEEARRYVQWVRDAESAIQRLREIEMAQ